MYRTFSVSSSKDHPTAIRFIERSGFRDAILDAYESFGANVTRHRLCCGTAVGYTVLNNLSRWAEKKATELYTLDVTRADIDALRSDPTEWWPGDPIEDDEDES